MSVCLNAGRRGQPPIEPNPRRGRRFVAAAAAAVPATVTTEDFVAVHLFADAVVDAVDAVAHVVHPVGREWASAVAVAVTAVVTAVAGWHGAAERPGLQLNRGLEIDTCA